MNNEGNIMLRLAAVEKQADQAFGSISSHERLCAERYDNIKERLSGIPRLFEAMDGLKKWVYIGMGICMTIPTLIEVMHMIVK